MGAQAPKSAEYGNEAHDEMLFIIVHQAYELWFKQILKELDSVLTVFSAPTIEDHHMGVIVSRLARIIEIQKLLIQQITVLETMTPQDFLEFRDYLYPASGFQSAQNRMIENKLGLVADQRIRFNQSSYEKHLDEKYRSKVTDTQSEPSLFEQVEKWLERTPFLNIEGFNFWSKYRESVESMFQADRDYIEKHSPLEGAEKENSLKEMDTALETFKAIFDEESYKEFRQNGAWRLSYNALHAALFINIYRDEPALQLPFQILQSLIDIDENFTMWRYRHALMAHRMLGRKIGTGGSSGHKYLKQATEKHKVFNDFFNLTTFFLPKSQRPTLPAEVKRKLSYNYSLEEE